MWVQSSCICSHILARFVLKFCNWFNVGVFGYGVCIYIITASFFFFFKIFKCRSARSPLQLVSRFPKHPEIGTLHDNFMWDLSVVQCFNASKMLKKMCTGYLAHLMSKIESGSSIDKTTMVQKFPNMLLSELLRLALERKVKFSIKLTSSITLISRAPY